MSVAEPRVYTLDDGRKFSCEQSVRSLPGRREVCVGTLDGAPVFAKLYLEPKRGERHWQRELSGLRAFQERDIPTAEILYAGRVKNEGWPVILLARIPDPVTFKAAWEEADDERRKQQLREMIVLLARHHRAGICQADLHLNNFVYSEQALYSLDGAGVTSVAGELGPAAAFDNLALFIAQLTPEWASAVPELYPLYLEQRGWRDGPGADGLRQLVRRARMRRWKEYRGKLFRDCTAFRCRHPGGRLEMVSRQAIGPELEGLLADPKGFLEQGATALKSGSASTVWMAQADGRALAVKEYHIKGLLHRLKGLVYRGRAVNSWEFAHRLLFSGIPTPPPVALLKGTVGGEDFYIAQAVDRVNSGAWFGSDDYSDEKKRRVADKIAGILRRLERERISHGDLKGGNVLVVGEEVYLADLDCMKRYRCDLTFRRAWRRDIRRFLHTWDHRPDIQELMRGALGRAGVSA